MLCIIIIKIHGKMSCLVLSGSSSSTLTEFKCSLRILCALYQWFQQNERESPCPKESYGGGGGGNLEKAFVLTFSEVLLKLYSNFTT